ncbi:MAG TPA: polyprenyl diphosphate synthase [Candidatus Nanoarchaeia archaeon]|nr:polyprenyl diphosphate synthase [Candidatus Nanoarchaeia archaeon]
MQAKLQHLGIILDGNRRYAAKKLKEPWKGHETGAEKVEQLFDWCRQLEITELTLYIFSLQNFKRDKKEVEYLMDLFCKFFTDPRIKDKIQTNQIKINFIGRIHLLSEKVQKIIHTLMEETKEYDQFTVNFAMAYGGREEIVDGINKILKENKLKKVDEKILSQYLYLQHEPDAIIRTGGERRTSNFLIWQSWYSEWFFLSKLWPEFQKEDLVKVVEEFSQRERRFGR